MHSLELTNCQRCPRLVAHHQQVRQQFPHYYTAPVPAWGDPKARLLVVGLAPGLHGAARTGKGFVGDASGDFLFASLSKCGFATSAAPDTATLLNTQITNVIKCLPPGNAPTTNERNNCQTYLEHELGSFYPSKSRKPRVIVCLGTFAHTALCRGLKVKKWAFGHGTEQQIYDRLWCISSFHPSRLNVNTKRLTAKMLDHIFIAAHRRLQ